MARIMGVGGVFFKCPDPAGLMAWYRDVLGLNLDDWGGAFLTPEAMAAHPGSGTVFSAFKADTTYFAPSAKEFMINLAVDNLDGMLERLAAHNVPVTVLPDEANGRFAHLVDPNGTKIELWEPKPYAA
jgi:predicted enzyme related to lactoylglutathione lyase